MDTLLFSLNAVLPIVLLVFIGWLLKKVGLFSSEFLRGGNKFTFKVLLPILLFYNVYQIQSFSAINWTFVAYGVAAIIAFFLLGTALGMAFTKDNAQRGVLIQALFRSNFALIGIPLATLLYGSEGAATASVLAAFCVPLFNILAVVTLSVFHGESVSSADVLPVENKTKVKGVVKNIVTNPLILGVVAGLVCLGIRTLFVMADINFRLTDIEFLYTTIKYIANAATPIALLVLGGQFEFSAVKRLWKPIVFGTVMRTVVFSAIALAVAYFFVPGLEGQHFAAYIGLFGTPVAVGSAIMAREMGGDGELAGQLVVWTTVVSAITLFAIISVFKGIGVF